MSTLPKLRKRKNRAQGYSYRICPYSTCDITNRVPSGEKTIHYTTSGYMRMDAADGHNIGFVCMDPNCSYYLGTATTPVNLLLRNTVISGNQYHVELIPYEVPMCSGTWFFEN